MKRIRNTGYKRGTALSLVEFQVSLADHRGDDVALQVRVHAEPGRDGVQRLVSHGQQFGGTVAQVLSK